MSAFNSTVRTRRKTRLATALALALGVVASQALGADSVPSLTTESVMAAERTVESLPANHDISSILIRGALSGDAAPARFQQQPDPTRTRQATGNLIIVTNCNDSGPGSLREAVALASSDDTVDISNLTCGAIKLTSSIVTTADHLTIVGAPERTYGIDGQNMVRPIAHYGNGLLTLSGVAIWNGRFDSSTEPALGGCVYSSSNVELINGTRVKYCSAENTNASSGANTLAAGGAVFARTTIELSNSIVSMGTATSARGMAAGGNVYAKRVTINDGFITSGTTNGFIASRGGGIYAKHFLGSWHTSISNNTASGGIATGGGAWIGGGDDRFTTLAYSTISGNTASGAAGLAAGRFTSEHDALTIDSCTIANNESIASTQKYGGAVYAGTNNVAIVNTTISGNIESNDGNKKYGAGVRIKPGVTALLISTVVGGNVLKKANSSTQPDDLTAADFSGSEPVNGTIVGSNNFIPAHLNTDVPADTLGLGGGLIPLDPELGPLADNGGYTKTMLPKPGSPLINAGRVNLQTYDQRGSGFPRIVGTAADIGAVEANDIIFANGFD